MTIELDCRTKYDTNGTSEQTTNAPLVFVWHAQETSSMCQNAKAQG